MTDATDRLESPASVDELAAALDAADYVPTTEIATVLYLAMKLDRPVLVEGPAGVGKTAIAAALSRITGRELIRLQCYEGLDEAKALYEWEYAKQLLYTQLLRDKIGEAIAEATDLHEAMELLADEEAVFFHERFLLPRPLLQAVLSREGTVLLIDEVDKADPEFEAFLLEILGDFQVTVPELGTYRATKPPLVVLTSNRARELSEALKRRCMHLYIDFPDSEREAAIVRTHMPDIDGRLNDQLVRFVQGLRDYDLRKLPTISETIDWARALVVLNADTLEPETVDSSLGLLLKFEEDRAQVRGDLQQLVEQARA